MATPLKKHFDEVKERIRSAENVSGRLNEVRLLAVSKKKPSEMICAAYELGQRHFGESYTQEALSKIKELSDLKDICWHFIGPIQSNKTRDLAMNFQWVHSIDRLKIASRLSEQRPPILPALNVCLQVNVSDESSKSGVSIANLSELVKAVSVLPNLKLRGLMTLPALAEDREKQRQPFRVLATHMASLNKAHHLAMDTLSMGMTGDLEAAIQEGATFVRIGTGLFGIRD